MTASLASQAGRDGEHIPRVECVSQTLLHVHRWDPEGEAEILIFGRPYYQRDVSKMILNLADYHRQLQLRAQSKRPGRVKGMARNRPAGFLGGFGIRPECLGSDPSSFSTAGASS